MPFLTARENGDLSVLAFKIDAWLQELLKEYFDRFKTNPHDSAKFVHDPVWGSIRLEPHELYIIDSPLLQRLRYVRQLGVAHFLFPSTGYSRFEHTLGTIEAAQRMLEALRVRGHAEVPASLSDPQRFLEVRMELRLAALLHDVGHCAFSHVSEKFYRDSPVLKAAQIQMEEHLGTKLTASEVLSILIITSPHMRLLLKSARIPHQMQDEKLVMRLAAFVAGSTTMLNADAYLAQIINSGVDCDKIDYLARDSHMGGTPIMLDPTRLISKLRLAKLPAGGSTYSLAIDLSGARAVEELFATRVFLYDKLYYHHKVVAAEELLRQGLEELSRGSQGEMENPANLIQFTDDELLHASPEHLMRSGVVRDVVHIEEATRLLRQVKNRYLPRRVFAFATRFLDKAPEYIALIEGNYANTDIGRDRYLTTRFFKKLRQGAFRRQFAGKIETYARELDPSWNGSVFVGFPNPGRVTGALSVLAVDADGISQPFDFLFAADRWAEAYASNKLTGYVYADHPTAKLHWAAERAFAEEGLSFGAKSRTLAKVEKEELSELRAAASGPWLLHRLPPTFLYESETELRVRDVADKLSQLLSPANLDPAPMIRGWLWQFPDVDLQDSALRTIEAFRIVNRADRGQIIQKVIRQIGSNGVWCPFVPQRKTKSADALAYFMRDYVEPSLQVRRLEAWTSEELDSAEQLIFIDDCLCTGAQASTLLYSWFGKQEHALSPSDVEDTLDARYLDVLRRVPVKFLFSVGFTHGKDVLLKACEELGVTAEVHLGIDAVTSGLTLQGVTFCGPESQNRFFQYMKDVGTDILQSRAKEKPHLTPDVQDFALGYGGLCGNFGFEYAVPTCTATPLWGHSFAGDRMWLPVVPRKPNLVWERLRGGLEEAASALLSPPSDD